MANTMEKWKRLCENDGVSIWLVEHDESKGCWLYYTKPIDEDGNVARMPMWQVWLRDSRLAATPIMQEAYRRYNHLVDNPITTYPTEREA